MMINPASARKVVLARQLTSCVCIFHLWRLHKKWSFFKIILNFQFTEISPKKFPSISSWLQKSIKVKNKSYSYFWVGWPYPWVPLKFPLYSSWSLRLFHWCPGEKTDEKSVYRSCCLWRMWQLHRVTPVYRYWNSQWMCRMMWCSRK